MIFDVLAVSVLLLIAPAKTKNIQWTLAKTSGVRFISLKAQQLAELRVLISARGKGDATWPTTIR